MVIMNYPFVLYGPFSVFVSVYAGDGTVAISHGGIECGQGINTKVTYEIITDCSSPIRQSFI